MAEYCYFCDRTITPESDHSGCRDKHREMRLRVKAWQEDHPEVILDPKWSRDDTKGVGWGCLLCLDGVDGDAYEDSGVKDLIQQHIKSHGDDWYLVVKGRVPEYVNG